MSFLAIYKNENNIIAPKLQENITAMISCKINVLARG